MTKTTIALIGVALLITAVAFIYFRTRKFRGSSVERTFAIIKPDAVKAKHTGVIIDMIESNGFTIIGMHKLRITKEKAREFYGVHKEKPFFGELVEFITSGPVVVLALEKENAIKAWRDLMGATNPANAAEGTIRKKFGTSIGNNATHGSDAPETAQVELGLFFPELSQTR